MGGQRAQHIDLILTTDQALLLCLSSLKGRPPMKALKESVIFCYKVTVTFSTLQSPGFGLLIRYLIASKQTPGDENSLCVCKMVDSSLDHLLVCTQVKSAR
jgi:hypothetical protein